jgi:CheY-like chemotaxis protein
MPQFMMLLMEDHPMQREIFVELLKGEGFEVVGCTTAEAAELVIAISGREFRAVVADQIWTGICSALLTVVRAMIGGSATAPAPAVARSASPLHPPCWQRDTSCRVARRSLGRCR